MTYIENIVAKLARAHRVPTAHVHAVIEVESGGQAFTVVRDRFGGSVNFPLCRFEGHLFYKNLSGAKRDQAVKAGLASPKIEKRGGIRNPKTQQGRYDLLHRAREIDPDAAVAACSWGVGQVLGSHWKRFGLSSPQDIYAKAGTLAGQLELMFDYIEAFGLMDELLEGQWAAFARGYNGKAYRTNKYDMKLAAAAVRHGASLPARDGMLRMGAKGPKVKEVQALLVRAGFGLKVDGDFGTSTRTAVQRFQRAAKVQVDGVVGPETFALLQNFLQGDREDLQKPGLVDVLQIPNIEKVAATVGGGAVLAQAKASVETLAAQAGDLAGQVAGIPTLASYATMAAAGLVTVAAVLGVAAAGYAAWEWRKSNRTYEGVPA